MLLTPFAADAEDEATQKFVSAYKKNTATSRTSLQQTLMMECMR